MWLAVLLVLGRVHEREPFPKPEVLESGVDESVLRRGRHRQGQPPRRAQVDGVLGPGLELTLAQGELDDPVDDLPRHLVGRRVGAPRVEAVPVGGDLLDEHPLGRATAFDGQRDAQGAEDLDLGLVPEHLGVNEEPIHVEDGGLEGLGGAGRVQTESCASMSATMVGSSGST